MNSEKFFRGIFLLKYFLPFFRNDINKGILRGLKNKPKFDLSKVSLQRNVSFEMKEAFLSQRNRLGHFIVTLAFMSGCTIYIIAI